MDGIDAVRAALIANSTLTALVPASRIAAGPLPQGSALPAIALQSISKVDRNIPNPGVRRHVTERVQATVLAPDYPTQRQVQEAMRHAAADTFPVVAGLSLVTIHTDGAGPDGYVDDPAAFAKPQDFIVQYNELR